MKVLLSAMLTLAAPAALAWPSCDHANLSPPVALKREAPAYPAAVRAIGVEGSVEVALTVLRDGRVGWVSILRADPPGYFEQAALSGVRAWRFEPAREKGVPVECRMLTRVRFTLVDTVDAAGPASGGARPDPVFPAQLLGNRVEGYAELQFELAADGSVVNADVIMAMPRGEFEAAALAAIRGWRFPPEPAARRMTRRFEFRLPDSTLLDVPPIMLASAPFPMEACDRCDPAGAHPVLSTGGPVRPLGARDRARLAHDACLPGQPANRRDRAPDDFFRLKPGELPGFSDPGSSAGTAGSPASRGNRTR